MTPESATRIKRLDESEARIPEEIRLIGVDNHDATQHIDNALFPVRRSIRDLAGSAIRHGTAWWPEGRKG